MDKKNISPIYFDSFLGNWKRISTTNRHMNNDSHLVFMKDCKYQMDHDYAQTINGDVDEVSIDGDEQHLLNSLEPISGTLKLRYENESKEWRFILQQATSMKPIEENAVLNELQLSCEGDPRNLIFRAVL